MDLPERTDTEGYDSFVLDRMPAAEALPEFRFDLPELQYPERLNAAVELLDRAVAEGEGARIAVRNDSGCWTYAELKSLSDRIARLLVEEEGLVRGNRVLLRGANSAFLYAAWFAVLKAGGVVVATMPMLRGGEIATLLRRAESGTRSSIPPAWKISSWARRRPAPSARC